MNITLFTNSTFYTSMPDINTVAGMSCLDHLRLAYPNQVEGLWLNGLTVLHVLPNMGRYLKERHPRNVVILNLGCVEAYSHPAQGFLHWTSKFLLENGSTPHFQSYVVPNMVDAAHAVCTNRTVFKRVVEPHHFGEMLYQIFLLLEGYTVIVVGMNRPNTNILADPDRWLSQGREFDTILRDVSIRFDNICYIPVWDSLSQYVVDSTHLTPEGHSKYFELVNGFLSSVRSNT